MEEKDLRLSLCVGSSKNDEERGISKKRRINEGDDQMEEAASDGGEDNKSLKKKLKLSPEQNATITEYFAQNSHPDSKQKSMLAQQLNILPQQVDNWFQNHRTRTRSKNVIEFYKRWNHDLLEQNRLLNEALEHAIANNLSMSGPSMQHPTVPTELLLFGPSVQHSPAPSASLPSPSVDNGEASVKSNPLPPGIPPPDQGDEAAKDLPHA